VCRKERDRETEGEHESYQKSIPVIGKRKYGPPDANLVGGFEKHQKAPPSLSRDS
jgi:hypothetical protein